MGSTLRWAVFFLLLAVVVVSIPGATNARALGNVVVKFDSFDGSHAVTGNSQTIPKTAAKIRTEISARPLFTETELYHLSDSQFPAAQLLQTPPPTSSLFPSSFWGPLFDGPPFPEPIPPLSPQPSIFEHAQVISFYGYPGFAIMGALGAYTPGEAITAVTRIASEYDAINGKRKAVPALHLIVAVAKKQPGENGLYLERIAEPVLNQYVEAARTRGVLLFLDIQVGWSDVLSEVKLLTKTLQEPFVHLALDPEFATRHTQTAPGIVIGRLDSEQINDVQTYLSLLVRELQLPPKVLVLHQFLDHMLMNTENYADVAEVDLTIDMDGYGNAYAKLANYERFSLSNYSERAAIKLFYDWDTPLITPEQLQKLPSPPDLVIYQ